MLRPPSDLQGQLDRAQRQAQAEGLREVRRLEGKLRGGGAFVALGFEGVDLVGRPVQAIIAVRLRSHDRAQIAAVMRLLPTLPEVVQSFHVAGDDDWLLHVAVASAEDLRDFVLDHLTVHEAVVHTRTTLVFAHDHGHPGPL